MLSWLNTLPEVLTTSHGWFIIDFLEWTVDPLLEFVRKQCKVCTGHLKPRNTLHSSHLII